MSNGSLTVLGLGELQADFERLAKAAGNKIVRDAVMAGARIARDKARAAAPVRTGKLKKNITATRLKQSDTPGGATAGVRVKSPKGKKSKALKRPGKKGRTSATDWDAPFYWKFLELGTSKMRAHPFIRPAWDGSLPQIEKAVSDKLAEGIVNAITR
ncbi:HK97 gp10 family phage protein [Pseudomonas putida]|uniref:HK97-gp10 family putative phage morphogenesis protein n=1 Tax=Pseudomonas putida TaxID=303 RepID=UPI0018E68620|nr:HK97-gp10 family putative phage morphogenesis protein [Pseudomonas putida]MBI6943734.1 HK97 gp10 family phage protein [Pseudomonas putida]MBI6959819.1 HK97 gp10 family phage protein [Pseudomonas putida]